MRDFSNFHKIGDTPTQPARRGLLLSMISEWEVAEEPCNRTVPYSTVFVTTRCFFKNGTRMKRSGAVIEPTEEYSSEELEIFVARCIDNPSRATYCPFAFQTVPGRSLDAEGGGTGGGWRECTVHFDEDVGQSTWRMPILTSTTTLWKLWTYLPVLGPRFGLEIGSIFRPMVRDRIRDTLQCPK